MKKNAGNSFQLVSNPNTGYSASHEILQIDSPRNRVDGPWLVVHKNVEDRWVIVLLHWSDNKSSMSKPCLGIRWFHGSQGTPSVRQYATWLIIPDDLTNAVLDKLPLSPQKRQVINEVLLGKRKLKELMKERRQSKNFTGISI